MADTKLKVDVKNLLKLIDEEYGMVSNFYGNGCEHGFKPAKNCTNADCSDKKLQLLFEKVKTQL